MCGKAPGAKYRRGLLECLAGRLFGVLERIADTESVPLETTHLVERQHLDALCVAELRHEFRDLRDVGRIISESRDQHEANPDRELPGGESACELQRRLVVTAGERPVSVPIPGLDTQQHQIDVVEIRVGELGAEKAIGLDRRMY